MSEALHVWNGSTHEVVELSGTRVSMGRGPSNDVVIAHPTSSKLHAVLEHMAGTWVLRDLASRNGTYVNGERLWGERALHPGDEIRVGEARLLFQSDEVRDDTHTILEDSAPRLTAREHDVLVALCRPVLAGNLFTDPATVHEIAAELVVSDTAVKQHLAKLFDKFQVYGDRRRIELANRAVRSGAVTLADLSS